MARTRAQSLRNVAQSVVGGAGPRAAARDELLRRTGGGGAQPSGGEDERFETGGGMDPADFPAAREQDGSSVDTVMRQRSVSLDEAGRR